MKYLILILFSVNIDVSHYSFGYSRAMSQLLTVPVYLFATIVLLSFAYCSDKYRRRGLSILVPQCMALVGFIINIADTPRGAKLFGMFLSIAGTYGSVPGTIAWLGCNLAPTYKRGQFPSFDCQCIIIFIHFWPVTLEVSEVSRSIPILLT